MDYSSWTVAALRAELVKQAAIHEAAALARRKVAEELNRRERTAGMRAKLSNLTPDELATLKLILSEMLP